MDTPLLGTYGQSGIDEAARVRESGCNALWYHGFDPRGFEAAEREGLNACVEFKTFRANFDERPDLVPIGVDGKPIRYGRLVQGVCLSKSDFVAEREEELIAGVNTFSPRGIWFDYLTGAGWFEVPEPDLQEACFCKDCVGEFCESTGIDADSAQEILSSHQTAWTDHKCERVAAFGHRFTAIIKEKLPDAIIGAYMCPWTPEEFGGALRTIFAQDYGLFTEFVDVFTPLFYAEKSGRPSEWTVQFLEKASGFVPAGKKVQPILDFLDFPASLEALAESPGQSWGFQLFAGATVFETEDSARKFKELSEAYLA